MKPIDPAEVRTAVGDAVRMLNEREQRRNQNMSMGKVILRHLERLKAFSRSTKEKRTPADCAKRSKPFTGMSPFTLEMVSQVWA
jgi:hypothetical protein